MATFSFVSRFQFFLVAFIHFCRCIRRPKGGANSALASYSRLACRLMHVTVRIFSFGIMTLQCTFPKGRAKTFSRVTNRIARSSGRRSAVARVVASAKRFDDSDLMGFSTYCRHCACHYRGRTCWPFETERPCATFVHLVQNHGL